MRLRGLRPCSFLPRGQGPQGSAHGGLCLQDGGPWLCRGRPAQIPAWEAEGAPASGRLLAVTPSCNGLWLLFLGAPRLGIAVGDPPSHTFTRHLKLSASQADLTFPKTRVLFSTGLWGAGGTLLCGPHAQ